MPAVAQPLSGWGDVIGRRFAQRFQQDGQSRGSRGHPRPATAASVGAVRWSGSMLMSMPFPSSGGALYAECPAAKPVAGTSGAGCGGTRRTPRRLRPVRVSRAGSNDSLPARARAVTISGLAMKFFVVALAIVAHGKVAVVGRQDRVRYAATPGERRHCPMHGPHAFASTFAPMPRALPSGRRARSWRGFARSRASPCSGTAAWIPCARACAATSAERLISS